MVGRHVDTVTASDRERWDERYCNADSVVQPQLPSVFDHHRIAIASVETALELACGAGGASVWLASQGVTVQGYDVSAVAVRHASALAGVHEVSDRCEFAVADFDDGLPDGPPVGLIMCHLFRDARLDEAIIERLQSGGLLALAALSEVGAEPGRFRVGPGELEAAFASLDIIDSAEANGVAWLIARK